MPYIKETQRKFLKTGKPRNAGELNYKITTILLDYIKDSECYLTYNDCLGALEGAKLELYRRQISDYEDIKIDENGDVFGN